MWFGSRRRKSPFNLTSDHAQSDASSVSILRDPQTPSNLTSVSNVPLDEVHAHIDDPSIYAPTPSLIHSTEREAERTSILPPSLAYQRDSAQPVLGSERGIPFTPQDAIVAQVFGRAVPPASPPQSSSAPHPSISMATSDSLLSPPSIPVAPSTRPAFTIYDPFSGARLSEHTPMSPSTTIPDDLSAPPPADDRRLWSSLERILELQAEIAAMHADMEGVGGKGPGNTTFTGGIASAGPGEGGNVGPRKRSRRGQTLPIGDEEPEEHGPAIGRAVSEISTDHSDAEDEDADEYDIHGYGKKRRDEEFARLAEQFAQRKAAIGGIMNKLDALSTALKTFHTVPPPLFDLAMPTTRADTPSSAPSSTSATPSPAPVQPKHPLSGLSPAFLSQAAGTPLTAPLSPPVPPISTLAPRVSLRDSSTPPRVAPIVAPILPSIAVLMVLPDAPLVESPAVDPAHRLFQGVSRSLNTGF